MSVINRYAIVRIPEHGAPPQGTVAHGSWPEVMGHFPSSRERNDAIATAVQARYDKEDALRLKEEALMAAARAINAEADRLAARQDSLSSRLRDERPARKKARADAQARAAKEYMDTLPDPDNPERTHHPGGELHGIDPVEPRQPAGVEDAATDAHDQLPEPKDPTGVSLEL